MKKRVGSPGRSRKITKSRTRTITSVITVCIDRLTRNVRRRISPTSGYPMPRHAALSGKKREDGAVSAPPLPLGHDACDQGRHADGTEDRQHIERGRAQDRALLRT